MAVTAIAGLVVLGAVVLGFLVLPAATVDVALRPAPLGPLQLSVTVDPTATAPNMTAGVVPGGRPTFQLAASGTFTATGTKVTDTKATGSVRWQNCDPTSAYRLPAGTVVRTASGVKFAIDESLFLPVAVLSGSPPTITCQYRDIAVTATSPGPAGNVPASAITVVPTAYNSVVLRVSNPQPTTGGTHTETTMVSQQDVDAATQALDGQLDSQLATDVADPTQIPAGQTAVAGTASRTVAVPGVDTSALVGQEASTFDLALSSTGSVTTFDQATLTSLAEQRLRERVPAGSQFVDGSVKVSIGQPVAEGQSATVQVTASAQAVPPVDVAVVRRQVEGLGADDARRALAGLGDVTVSLWPFWVSTVPTYDFRVDVRVTSAPSGTSAGSTPAPTGSATP